jgi:glycopeptide antibiotics resistance protein
VPLASDRPRRLLIVLFVIYLVLLAWAILWKFEIPYVGRAAGLARPIKLVPFLPSGDYDASNPFEVLGNVLLFIPFGLYLGSLARTWRWWMLTTVFLGASLMLEVTQHLLSTGSFDTSDLISNTAGGLAGLGLLALARRRLGARVPTIGIRVGVIGTALSLIAIAILFASPLRYGPQHDVIVPRHASAVFDARRLQ